MRRRASRAPRPLAAAALALVAAVLLHAPRRAAAQIETAGYDNAGDTPGDAGPRVSVSNALPDGTRCAETVEEMAPLFAQMLTPDVADWTHPPGEAAGAPPKRYNISDFQEFVAHGGANPGQLVLIHNNSWYYFAHARAAQGGVVARRAATPEEREEGDNHPWVTAMHWWFEEAVTAWGWTCPGARARGVPRLYPVPYTTFTTYPTCLTYPCETPRARCAPRATPPPARTCRFAPPVLTRRAPGSALRRQRVPLRRPRPQHVHGAPLRRAQPVGVAQSGAQQRHPRPLHVWRQPQARAARG
jgi:hypothetical protein